MGDRLTPVKLFVESLKSMDIPYVFGVPGRAIMPLYNAAYDLGFPTPVLASHETGAAFMALTWAQLVDKPGVCCATTGPGASNLITGVATAFTEGVPLLVLTGQVPLASFGTRAYQESTGDGRTVDTVSLFRPVTKRSGLAVSGEHLMHLLASYLQVAREGRPGPVHISVPWDVWDQELVVPDAQRLVDRMSTQPTPRYPNTRQMTLISGLLMDASYPIMLTGRGVARAQAGEDALKCAEKWGLPLFTTTRGKGGVRFNRKFLVGHVGPAASPEALAWVKRNQIDLLLAVGTSLGPMALGPLYRDLQAPTTIIQVNNDEEEHGALWRATHHINCDAKLFLKELIDLAPAEATSRSQTAEQANDTATNEPYPSSLPDGLHPGAVMSVIRDSLPEDAIILPDSGSHWLWAMRLIECRFSNSILPGRSFGAMGQATAGAIGAKLASPERPVVAITGDGSFLMHGTEIAAAIRIDLPVTWIVFNDRSHNRIYTAQRLDFNGRIIATTLPEIDFSQMAAGFGLWSCRVQVINQLSEAIKSALKSSGPSLVEVMVSREATPPL